MRSKVAARLIGQETHTVDHSIANRRISSFHVVAFTCFVVLRSGSFRCDNPTRRLAGEPVTQDSSGSRLLEKQR